MYLSLSSKTDNFQNCQKKYHKFLFISFSDVSKQPKYYF